MGGLGPASHAFPDDDPRVLELAEAAVIDQHPADPLGDRRWIARADRPILVR
jgi:hypothetical protein